VAIRRTLAEDLYIVMPAFELQEQTASVEIHINPLVNWIWVGFGLMAVGTGIALLPERAYSFAVAKLPAEAAAALLLISLLLFPAAARAQHVEGPPLAGELVVRSPVERAVGQRIICMCGGCGRQLVGVCACGYAAQMRSEIRQLVEQGRTEDDIVQYYIAKYGSQEPLAAPLDQGFNRLAWLFPYLVGVGGLVVIGVTARRWARRQAAEETPAAAAAPEQEAELQARLDDELRDLD
jgi:cytochrome c-type biogenesis protein CcmH/NrfF